MLRETYGYSEKLCFSYALWPLPLMFFIVFKKPLFFHLLKTTCLHTTKNKTKKYMDDNLENFWKRCFIRLDRVLNTPWYRYIWNILVWNNLADRRHNLLNCPNYKSGINDWVKTAKKTYTTLIIWNRMFFYLRLLILQVHHWFLDRPRIIRHFSTPPPCCET